jgi:hypothetical protein
MMIIKECPQLSEEWFKTKLGVPSASNFHKIVTPKGDPSTQAASYMDELMCEIGFGGKVKTFQSSIMARGVELEKEARDLFGLIHNIQVKQTGVIFEDRLRYCCSPDGLLEDAGLEIKCPIERVHNKYLSERKLPANYVQQVQGSMLITGFNNWWFMSYHPEQPPLVLKIERDEEFIARLTTELDKFTATLAAKIEIEAIHDPNFRRFRERWQASLGQEASL